MITTKYESREQWMASRMGKITGSRAGDVVPKKTGTGKKIGFYELVAERLTVPETDGMVPSETPMERGTRLQSFAIDRFKRETGKAVDESLVLWSRDDCESIAVSPDGVMEEGREAIETKCLSSARHVEAYATNRVPDEYRHQVLQYFAVNDVLERLWLCFYDPRIACRDFFFLKIERADLFEACGDTPESAVAAQKKTIAEVDNLVARMSDF